MTVSLRLYLDMIFGKSFSFLQLSFNSPLSAASSKIRSSDRDRFWWPIFILFDFCKTIAAILQN